MYVEHANEALRHYIFTLLMYAYAAAEILM